MNLFQIQINFLDFKSKSLEFGLHIYIFLDLCIGYIIY